MTLGEFLRGDDGVFDAETDVGFEAVLRLCTILSPCAGCFDDVLFEAGFGCCLAVLFVGNGGAMRFGCVCGPVPVVYAY